MSIKRSFKHGLVAVLTTTILTGGILPAYGHAEENKILNTNEPISINMSDSNMILSEKEATNLMENVATLDENAIVNEDSVEVEIKDSELFKLADEEGIDTGIKSVRGTNGVTKIKFHKWGIEIWMSKAFVKTLGGIGGAGLLLNIAFPGLGIWGGIILGSIYNAYILDKARAVYVKKWYSGKRVVAWQ